MFFRKLIFYLIGQHFFSSFFQDFHDLFSEQIFEFSNVREAVVFSSNSTIACKVVWFYPVMNRVYRSISLSLSLFVIYCSGPTRNTIQGVYYKRTHFRAILAPSVPPGKGCRSGVSAKCVRQSCHDVYKIFRLYERETHSIHSTPCRLHPPPPPTPPL